MRLTPTTELEHRCKKVQEQMAVAHLDGILVLQNADLFYFTGTTQSGNLYIPAEGQPLYMVRKDFGRARMESGLKEVIPFSSLRDVPRVLADYGYPLPVRIGLELDVLPVNLYERYRKLFPGAVFSDASPLIRSVRMIKSHYEIHILQDAAHQVDKVYRRAREVIRPGMTDLELAAELEFTIRKAGHQGLLRMRGFNSELFYAHVFSGADSAVPAYMDSPLGGVGLSPAFGQGASYKPIAPGEPIIIDFAGCCDGYMVDMTRVFSLGPLSDRLRKGYDDMLRIQELMLALTAEHPTWSRVYDECHALAVSMGYAEHFMGNAGSQVSFIGHGIGIEVDEYPFLARGYDRMTLDPGMVFAFEPKLVFPGEGAVGIENTFYISNEGVKQLTVTDERITVL